jgi:outer membrane protein
MSLPSLNVVARRAAAIALAGVLSVGGWAQDSQPASTTTQPAPPQAPQPQQFVLKDYAKPRSHFPNLIAPYTAQHVAPPDFTNTPRISQLMQNGKIYLSMDDAVALALENNLDIGIARYNLNIADTDILRAKAGGSTLGINVNPVINTPGGPQSTIGS